MGSYLQLISHSVHTSLYGERMQCLCVFVLIGLIHIPFFLCFLTCLKYNMRTCFSHIMCVVLDSQQTFEQTK